MLNSWWESLTNSLARTLGDATGLILSGAAYLIMASLLWGLPWHFLIYKAGFRKNSYWKRLLFVMSPWFIIPATNHLFGNNSDFSSWVEGLVGFIFYVFFLFFAVAPWPIYKEKGSFQKKSKCSTD